MSDSDFTRRFFLRAGAALAAGFSVGDARADSPSPELAKALEKLESYFTAPDDFQDVSRGKPLPPVIVCYKLNGEWLTAERGGPVRIVVPEGYGFKSIKWLTHIVLSNLGYANDTYLDGNNDVDSALKTFAATLQVPNPAPANQPF